MLDSIINSVKDQVGEKLQSAIGLDAGKAGESVKVAGESMFDTLKSTVTSGKLGALKSLLGSGENGEEGNGILNSINSNVVSSLTEKIGLSADQASSAGKELVPSLLNGLKEKVTGGDGSLNLGSLTSMLGVGDIAGKLGDMAGGVTGAAGDVAGKAGGILGAAKSLFGKK
ncbi:MAG: hypothetical protein KJO64_01505 [Bacteroidia bacterium]|nr:hypothetical protein [Bacteroidia bacterium]NNC84971.1 hypothetical protein [Bacteroidia bacterium]